MGGASPEKRRALDSEPHTLSFRRGQRVANRQVFREMVRAECEHHPIGFFRRRALVRFAQRLDIEAYEARLTIMAVEYECRRGQGLPNDSTEGPDEHSDAGMESAVRFVVVFLAVVANVLLFRWLVATMK